MQRIDNNILKELKEGLNPTQIADKLGIKLWIVSNRIKIMQEQGIEIPDFYKENDEIDNMILEFLSKGLIQTQIAKELGVSDGVISNRIRKMEDRGIDILSFINEDTEIDNAILQMFAQGLCQKQMIAELNLPKGIVLARIKKLREKDAKIPKITKVSEKKRGRSKKIENDETDNRILNLLGDGLNQVQIASVLGLRSNSISRRIKKMKERGVSIPTAFSKKADSLEESNVKIANDEQRINSAKEKKIAEQIIKLMDTKNASTEQVRILARIYNVNIEGLLMYIEEKER